MSSWTSSSKPCSMSISNPWPTVMHGFPSSILGAMMWTPSSGLCHLLRQFLNAVLLMILGSWGMSFLMTAAKALACQCIC